jgi:hypothetical protein
MPDVNELEHADITTKRRAVLQSLEAAVAAREQQNLAERISLIMSEVRKAGDGDLVALAEAIEAGYVRSVFEDFGNVTKRAHFDMTVKIQPFDAEYGSIGILRIKNEVFGNNRASFR